MISHVVIPSDFLLKHKDNYCAYKIWPPDFSIH